MFLATVNTLSLLSCLLWVYQGVLVHAHAGCNHDVACPTNSGTECRISFSCSQHDYDASCIDGRCRCNHTSNYDDCTCLPHVSGCLIKESPSTYVGFPSTDGEAETPFYGCVSDSFNCEYEVHVIGNHESSRFVRPGNTYVHLNIRGQSSKPLILAFAAYEQVNWQLSSVNAVDMILYSRGQGSKVVILSGNRSTTVVQTGLGLGYGIGRHTVNTIMFLTERFGPISSFSGSYRADRWTVNIVRSPACTPGQPLQLRFDKERYAVNESSGSVTLVLLTNKRSAQNIVVLYSTTDGTAQAPMDYTPASNNTIVIPAGNIRFEFAIPIQDDGEHEMSETFQVWLSLGNEPICNPATVEIIDNDQQSASVHAATIGGSIGVAGGIVILICIGGVVFFIVQRSFCRKSQVPARTSDGTVPTGSSSIQLSTHQHTPYPNLAQPQPTAHTPTFTEPSNPSITEAPPPAYQFHERFANYSEKKKQSDGLPPYNSPPYDVSTKETKCEPLNFPQD